MLKYLWTVTQDLFLMVTMVTLMHAALGRLFGRRGKMIHGIALGAGAAASAALAIVKKTTNLIISSRWNHYIYGVLLVLIGTILIFGRYGFGFDAGQFIYNRF